MLPVCTEAQPNRSQQSCSEVERRDGIVQAQTPGDGPAAGAGLLGVPLRLVALVLLIGLFGIEAFCLGASVFINFEPCRLRLGFDLRMLEMQLGSGARG